MSSSVLRKRVVSRLSEISDQRGVYVLLPKSLDYDQLSQEVVRCVTKNFGFSGVYVTLNKSHCDLVTEFKKRKINVSNLSFIDNVEVIGGGGADNCIFLDGNNSLTALSFAISKACKRGSVSFLFFDSLSTILLNHKLAATKKFIHYLINKIQNLDLLILMPLEKKNSKKLAHILSPLCTEIIDV